MDAKDALRERLTTIKKTLKAIEKELKEYESVSSPDWGYVGDLAYVDSELENVWKFLTGAEE